MKAWDEEFGYELVEGDIALQYPPADPVLREELERAVRDARQRQAALAAAMPSQFEGGGKADSWLRRRGVALSVSEAVSLRSERRRRRRRRGGWGGSGQGAASSGDGSAAGGAAAAGRPGSGAAGPGGSSGAPGGQSPLGEAASGNASEAAASGQSTAHGSSFCPLANSRGKNWALPKEAAQATGITRPIRIACLRDQLVILPEKGEHQAPKVVAAPGQLADVMDEFVSAIWKHMDQWGIAVAGGYWKPELRVQVGSGAEARFEELRTVLTGSGMEVQEDRMKGRRATPNADAPGQDSFMDVVTNLVGILIILVMVVGVRAKDAMLDSGPAAKPATEEPAPDVRSAQQAAQSVESDIHQLSATLGRQDLEIAYRREERNRVQLLVGAIEEEIANRRGKLDASQQQQFDSQRSLIAAQTELEQLQRGRQALENAPPSVEVIEHLPTPMAKTVFGKEIHFRLGGGRVTYVPWDELVEQLKREAPHKVWRLKDATQFTETLGPIGGFWMKYTLKRTEHTLPTTHGHRRAESRGARSIHFDTGDGRPRRASRPGPRARLPVPDAARANIAPPKPRSPCGSIPTVMVPFASSRKRSSNAATSPPDVHFRPAIPSAARPWAHARPPNRTLPLGPDGRLP